MDISPSRQLLTETLWLHRDKVRRFYRELTDYNNAFRPFEICRDGFNFKLMTWRQYPSKATDWIWILKKGLISPNTYLAAGSRSLFICNANPTRMLASFKTCASM